VTEVWVRHVDEVDGYFLTNTEVEKVDDVIAMLTRWGLHAYDREWSQESDFTGQFTQQGRHIVFEILLGWGEDDA